MPDLKSIRDRPHGHTVSSIVGRGKDLKRIRWCSRACWFGRTCTSGVKVAFSVQVDLEQMNPDWFHVHGMVLGRLGATGMSYSGPVTHQNTNDVQGAIDSVIIDRRPDSLHMYPSRPLVRDTRQRSRQLNSHGLYLSVPRRDYLSHRQTHDHLGEWRRSRVGSHTVMTLQGAIK
jgi:hypothetical protein